MRWRASVVHCPVWKRSTSIFSARFSSRISISTATAARTWATSSAASEPVRDAPLSDRNVLAELHPWPVDALERGIGESAALLHIRAQRRDAEHAPAIRHHVPIRLLCGGVKNQTIITQHRLSLGNSLNHIAFARRLRIP